MFCFRIITKDCKWFEVEDQEGSHVELKQLRAQMRHAASISDMWDSAVDDTKSAIQLLGVMPDEHLLWDNAMEALHDLLDYNTDKATAAEDRYIEALEKCESVEKKLKKA